MLLSLISEDDLVPTSEDYWRMVRRSWGPPDNTQSSGKGLLRDEGLVSGGHAPCSVNSTSSGWNRWYSAIYHRVSVRLSSLSSSWSIGDKGSCHPSMHDNSQSSQHTVMEPAEPLESPVPSCCFCIFCTGDLLVNLVTF